MHNFDYSFLNNGMLPATLINVTTDIYSMRAMKLSAVTVLHKIIMSRKLRDTGMP